MSRTPERSPRRRLLTACGIFVAALLVYRESPVLVVNDAHYTLLQSTALLDGHGLNVAPYLPRPLDPERYPGMGRPRDRDGLPYQIMEVDGRLVPYYAPGTAVLSAPLLALMRPLGYGPLDSRGGYDHVRELRAMKHIAFFAAALFAVFAFLIASELLPPLAAFVIAMAAAIASPAWSTLSRSLWSHDGLVVLVAAAIWLLVRAECRGRRPPAVVLATLTSWATIVRPTGVLPVAVLGVYLLVRSRPAALRYACTAAVWMAGFGIWSRVTYGTFLPPYYTSHVAATGGLAFVEGIAGTLVSPSRGLLVFCPWILWIAWLLVRHRGAVRAPRWVAVAVPVILTQIVVVASSPKWWGGFSYGPRLMADILPWLLLLAVLALDASRRRGAARGKKSELVAGAALVILAVAMHAPGALSWRTHEWNALPIALTRYDSRLWSWSDPQFLAWRPPRVPLPESTSDDRSGTAE